MKGGAGFRGDVAKVDVTECRGAGVESESGERGEIGQKVDGREKCGARYPPPRAQVDGGVETRVADVEGGDRGMGEPSSRVEPGLT